MRERSTKSWLMSNASTCVTRSSNTSALVLRKSLSVWWLKSIRRETRVARRSAWRVGV
ncbi:MAG: hypothetical protein HYZ29_30385 [Myxococcales bacterium]|nr:hypothetical protein [Myxococcales bacterium]